MNVVSKDCHMSKCTRYQ